MNSAKAAKTANNVENSFSNNSSNNTALEVLNKTNWAYIINTLVRPIGIHASDVIYNTMPYLGREVYVRLDLFKSVSHTLGFIYGYYRIGVNQTTHDSTKYWLLSSAISNVWLMASGLLLADNPYCFYRRSFFFLNQLFYKFWQGFRDSTRPIHYKRLSLMMNDKSVDVSDAFKSQLKIRKLYTTCAEIIGGLAVTVLSSMEDLFGIKIGNNIMLLSAAAANLITLVKLWSPISDIHVVDNTISKSESYEFSKHYLPKFFVSLPSNIISGTYSSYRSTIDLAFKHDEFGKKEIAKKKHNAFLSSIVMMKLAIFGISKNLFLTHASYFPGYSETKANMIRSWSTFLTLLMNDIIPSWYRSRFGIQMLSSIHALKLGILLSNLAIFTIWLTTVSGNLYYSMAGGYSLYVLGSAFFIGALNHLTEIWGQDDDTENNSLSRSFDANITSMLSGMASKFLLGFWLKEITAYLPFNLISVSWTLLNLQSLQKASTASEKV